MYLPINDGELSVIVSAMRLGGDAALYQKLKLVKDLKEQGLPYKKILREEYGMVSMMIKVKYHLKEFPNSTLSKFFKTKEQVEIFKYENAHYIFE